jgi:maltose alpha-D-glucosyltransferase/alpha-amylase
MQWDASRNAGFSTAPSQRLYAPPIEDGPFAYPQVNGAAAWAQPDSLWQTLRQMITARKQQTVLGDSVCEPILDNGGTVLTLRHTAATSGAAERLEAVHNLSAQRQTLTLADDGPRAIALTSRAAGAPTLTERTLTLPPFSYLWLNR